MHLVQVLVSHQSTSLQPTAYLYGLSRSGEYDGSAWVYYLADHLGSVRSLADDDGEVVGMNTYRPYGETLSTAGSVSTMYGFTGEAVDVTGLVYLRARYYAPGWGGFVSRDPWDGDGQRPLTFNTYLYALGNPICVLDPSGQIPCSDNECRPTPLKRDPIKPGGCRDLRIKFATVIIKVGYATSKFERSLGTVVRREVVPGTDNEYLVIYTHNHFGLKMKDPSQLIRIWDFSHSHLGSFMQQELLFEERHTDMLVVKVPADDRLDGSVIPIDSDHNSSVAVGDKVDVAYLSPFGPDGDSVKIWHTEIGCVTELCSIVPDGYIASRGRPLPSSFDPTKVGPGGPGDSGGGVFLNGRHIANHKNWAAVLFSGCKWWETFWISKLNVGL